MTTAELIKNIRLQSGLTQDQFAAKIHVAFSTVNRWENNKAVPNQMARALLTDFCEKQGIDKVLIDELNKGR